MNEVAESPAAPGRSERFFLNVLWNWAGVAISLVSGFVLSPYIIRKLGAEGYGVWTLVFSLVEYYWLLDMGFRSATVKFSAHYRATGELDKVNRILNTGLAYFSGVALVLLFGSILISGSVGTWFAISPGYRDVFAYLVILVGVSWGMGTVFSVFDASLEGFQRFDVSSRIWMSVTTLRVIGSAVLLLMGYRILALGIMAVSSQLFGYLLSFICLRRVFPQIRFGLSFISLKTFREMWGYGMHTVVASVSERLLNQNPNLLIGHFRPSADVGFFSVPMRLLQYVAEAVYRVGSVTASNTAEFCAHGETDRVARLGMYTNRYCLSLFIPLGIFLWVYGPQFIQVWINPEYARQSLAVLPVLTVAYEFAIAAQFNSSTILFGLGKHRGYSRGLLAEAILSAIGLYVVIPRYGIGGAAWVVGVLMILNRGIFTPWLVCHHLRCSYARYMASIYIRPTLAAIPAFILAVFLKESWIPGNSWLQIGLAAMIFSTLYYAIAAVLCLEKEHRTLLITALRTRLRLSSAAQAN